MTTRRSLHNYKVTGWIPEDHIIGEEGKETDEPSLSTFQ